MASPFRPNAKPLAELIGPSLDPVVRKRGLARAELLAWWPDIVGEAYAGRTLPERIRWPRDGGAAVLVVKCDPSLALQLSYETAAVRERLNTFLGYPAVGAVKIIQHPVGQSSRKVTEDRELSNEAAGRLEARIAGVGGPLQQALRELGRQVLARS